MDFKDQIKALGERVGKLKEHVTTEEATKTAMIMPFIQALGYDVFNPHEVVPEFIADLGIKKGEKVDYAIVRDGNPVMLIECKWCGECLDVHNSQLFRYFHTTQSRFGLLTNGVNYRFYTDLVEPNKMDEKPFLEFNITDMRETVVEELKKFHKSYFDVDQVLSAASELKYSNEVKAMIGAEFSNPSEAFVRHFARKVYPKSVTEKVLTQFTDIVKKSFYQFTNDIINDRLKSALSQEQAPKEENLPKAAEQAQSPAEEKIQTTDEEKEAFFIIKAILRHIVDPGRIVYRDTQSYLNVLLDNTIRKQICRLYLNAQKKYLGVFEDKKERRIEIANLDDIYAHSDVLIKTVSNYEGGVSNGAGIDSQAQ